MSRAYAEAVYQQPHHMDLPPIVELFPKPTRYADPSESSGSVSRFLNQRKRSNSTTTRSSEHSVKTTTKSVPALPSSGLSALKKGLYALKGSKATQSIASSIDTVTVTERATQLADLYGPTTPPPSTALPARPTMATIDHNRAQMRAPSYTAVSRSSFQSSRSSLLSEGDDRRFSAIYATYNKPDKKAERRTSMSQSLADSDNEHEQPDRYSYADARRPSVPHSVDSRRPSVPLTAPVNSRRPSTKTAYSDPLTHTALSLDLGYMPAPQRQDVPRSPSPAMSTLYQFPPPPPMAPAVSHLPTNRMREMSLGSSGRSRQASAVSHGSYGRSAQSYRSTYSSNSSRRDDFLDMDDPPPLPPKTNPDPQTHLEQARRRLPSQHKPSFLDFD